MLVAAAPVGSGKAGNADVLRAQADLVDVILQRVKESSGFRPPRDPEFVNDAVQILRAESEGFPLRFRNGRNDEFAVQFQISGPERDADCLVLREAAGMEGLVDDELRVVFFHLFQKAARDRHRPRRRRRILEDAGIVHDAEIKTAGAVPVDPFLIQQGIQKFAGGTRAALDEILVTEPRIRLMMIDHDAASGLLKHRKKRVKSFLCRSIQ